MNASISVLLRHVDDLREAIRSRSKSLDALDCALLGIQVRSITETIERMTEGGAAGGQSEQERVVASRQ